MPEPRLLPLGFIDRTTDDGAIIMLTIPSESHNIRPETPVTLRGWNTGTTNATARVRGVITSVGYVTATFKAVETSRAPNWPPDQPVLQRRLPVYQALPDSFKPDPARTLTDEQAADLDRLAARYREITKPRGSRARGGRRLSRNGATPNP